MPGNAFIDCLLNKNYTVAYSRGHLPSIPFETFHLYPINLTSDFQKLFISRSSTCFNPEISIVLLRAHHVAELKEQI